MDILDFVKLNYQNTETNIRAYDTKSQIILASTAFTFNPIFIAIRQFDTSASVTARLGVVFVLFAAALLMFLRVLAPVTGSSGGPVSTARGLFYLRDPDKFDPAGYVAALREADLMLEYSQEVLVLHRIRRVKHRRFQQALVVLALYIGLVLLYAIAALLRLF